MPDLESMTGHWSEDERREAITGDEDFHALHRLINGVKVAEDEGVQSLRQLVNDHRRRRLHEALDRVLDRVAQRRCAGDRFRGGR